MPFQVKEMACVGNLKPVSVHHSSIWIGPHAPGHWIPSKELIAQVWLQRILRLMCSFPLLSSWTAILLYTSAFIHVYFYIWSKPMSIFQVCNKRNYATRSNYVMYLSSCLGFSIQETTARLSIFGTVLLQFCSHFVALRRFPFSFDGVDIHSQ